MRALGFDNYEGVLKVYLTKFREVSYRFDFALSLSCLCLPSLRLQRCLLLAPPTIGGCLHIYTKCPIPIDALRRQSIP